MSDERYHGEPAPDLQPGAPENEVSDASGRERRERNVGKICLRTSPVLPREAAQICGKRFQNWPFAVISPRP